MHFTLADAEPMSAFLGSGTFKNLATLVLIAIAVLALVAPAALAKIKTMIAGWVEDKLRDLTPVLTQQSQSPGPRIEGEKAAVQASVDEVVQQRAAALKNACPKAAPDLRLRWLEQGLDPLRAQVDYISILEAKVAEPVTAATVASPSA